MTSFCRFFFLHFSSPLFLPLPPHLPKHEEKDNKRGHAHHYRKDYEDSGHNASLPVEPVPHGPDRLDIRRLLRVIFEYLAQFQNEIVNRPIGRIDMIPPDRIQ